jgi:hypothetical protein
MSVRLSVRHTSTLALAIPYFQRKQRKQLEREFEAEAKLLGISLYKEYLEGVYLASNISSIQTFFKLIS